MKKFLIFLVMITLMSVLVLGVDQGIEVTINPDIHVVIAPTSVNFGSVLPNTNGNPAVVNVSFDATGSNVNVSVAVTTVTGEPFKTGLKFNGTKAEGQNIVLACIPSGETCTYTLKTVDTTLDVPAAFPKGTKTGIITYTITEAI